MRRVCEVAAPGRYRCPSIQPYKALDRAKSCCNGREADMREIADTKTVIRSRPLEPDAAAAAEQAEKKKQEAGALDGSPGVTDVIQFIGDATSLAADAVRAVGGAVGDGCKA